MPPPPTVITLADLLGGGPVHSAPRRAAADDAAADDRWMIERRVDIAVDGQARRRRPRNVPRKRAARRRRRRALPRDAPPPGIVHDFTADDPWHRRQGLWAFDSANADCWDSAKQYMELSSADVVCAQEAKLRSGDPILGAQRDAASVGWQVSTEGCDITDCGYPSAGVAIGVRSHLGIATPPISIDDPRLHHRVHVRWIGTVCKGGILVITIYLWNGERMSHRNREILEAVAAVLATCGGLWLIAADFQMSPADLLKSGWPELVGGVVVAPTEPTCPGSTIDSFVLAQALAPAVRSVAVVWDSGFYPHSPVRLTLRAAPRRLLVRRLVAPRRVPAFLATACMGD